MRLLRGREVQSSLYFTSHVHIVITRQRTRPLARLVLCTEKGKGRSLYYENLDDE